ncbi:hypothetical protein TVAG_172430 [Trichomonas vaginalis G3]|uniref:Uncharacterized protein n=1 Tax=Trichomonas vaginalis (strain ATCC PRA-98 / G3) TaxID=412133 RepID=A2DEZ4_TRIV3|nr:MULE transposase domain-containing protein [Trichomonas vaginalis G3]EAY20986.1 hypothetical protein TVAG_172430 [Trichomonas vaginalis G3]KAI5519157.1 MULE transposase domain-containing protein [Trichomonas vaginalis G3]|eukprot:XP_001581972.1 hypothetical protein [Trichomonas vaginalis G3]
MGKSSIFNQKRANFTDENKIFIREQSDKYQKSTSRDEKTNIIKQVLQYFNIKYHENESKAVRRYFSYIAVKNIPAVTGKYPDTIVRKDMLYSHDHTNIINSNNLERYYRCIDHSCQARYLVKIENSSVSEDLQKEHIPECRQFKKLQNEKNDLHKSMTLTEIYNKAMAKFSEDNGTFQ